MLANLKLRHLRLIVALDDERQVQRAATTLSLTQSAASKMLAEIEAIAQVPLFDRTARGVQPTPYGSILIRGGRSVLSNLDQAVGELASYVSGHRGSVRIGTVAAPCLDLINDVIDYLGERLEAIKITLDVAISPSLIGRLLAHELDFVAARIPAGVDANQFNCFDMDDEEACLLVRSEHPLADRNVVDLAELVDQQWICQPPDSFLRQCVENLFTSHGILPPSRVIDTESLFAALTIAARTNVIAPVPALILGIIDRTRFRRLPIGHDLILPRYALVTLKNRPLSPAARAILEAMKRCRALRETNMNERIESERSSYQEGVRRAFPARLDPP